MLVNFSELLCLGEWISAYNTELEGVTCAHITRVTMCIVTVISFLRISHYIKRLLPKSIAMLCKAVCKHGG